MAWIRRRGPDVPGWAAPLDGREFAQFTRALEDELGGRAHTIDDDGMVHLAGVDIEMALHTLVALWAQSARSDRRELVAAHVAQTLGAVDRADLTAEQTLSAVRPRLWDSDTMARLNDAGGPLFTRRVAPGIEALLTLDLPDIVVNLTRAEAQSTGFTEDQLWQHAIGQIEDGLEVSHQETQGVRIIHGDSFFITSRILDLQRFIEPLDADGALVVVPRRHMLAWRPISNGEIIGAAGFIARLAVLTFGKGPGSLTPEVYWWRSHQIEHIGVQIDGKATDIQASDEFVDMVERQDAYG